MSEVYVKTNITRKCDCWLEKPTERDCFGCKSGEKKPIFKTVEEGQKIIEDRIGLLNRLIRQHPENPTVISWINIKEFLEKELLGYEIKWET